MLSPASMFSEPNGSSFDYACRSLAPTSTMRFAIEDFEADAPHVYETTGVKGLSITTFRSYKDLPGHETVKKTSVFVVQTWLDPDHSTDNTIPDLPMSRQERSRAVAELYMEFERRLESLLNER